MKIQLYKKDGSPSILLGLQNPKLTQQLMGADTITFGTTLNAPHDFQIGDYLDFEDTRYTLNMLPSCKKHSTTRFEYSLVMEAPFYQLRRAQVLFYGEDTDLARNGMADFSLVGSPSDFLYLIVQNANRIGGTWQVGTAVSAPAKELSFNCNYCLEALARVAQE